MSRSPRLARLSMAGRRCAVAPLVVCRYGKSGGMQAMRYWAMAGLMLAACQQQVKAPQKPAEITFDGAQVTNVAARAAHGERLSWTLGCRGCHRDTLEGGSFYERYASNLTREVPKYSDAEIE